MKRYEPVIKEDNGDTFKTVYDDHINIEYNADMREDEDGEWVKWEDVELLIERLDGFLTAYPEDLFPEPTKDQYKEAHRLLEQIRPGFGSAMHGAWGRHITRCIADSLGTISDDVETTKPD